MKEIIPATFMSDLVKSLLAVQEHDLRIDGMEAELRRIPEAVRECQGEIAAARQQVEEEKKQLNALQVQRKQKEVDLAAKEGEIRKRSGELNVLKSNEAYKAMLGEIAKGKEEMSALEDEILKLFDEVDKLAQHFKMREGEIKVLQAAVDQKIQTLEEQKAKLEGDLAQQNAERQNLAQSLSKPQAEMYQRLRRNRKIPSVVLIKGENCSGCNMRISQNLINDARRGTDLVLCEHCSRILYIQQPVTAS